MPFVWFWETKAIIFPYHIKGLVFISEKKSVYCAVRAEALNKLYIAATYKAVFELKRLELEFFL